MSRRFAFCASHRLGAALDERTAREAFGEERRGRLGHGHNYVAHVVFGGSVDPKTGILANLSEVKSRVGRVIDGRYDHRFLNRDTTPFDRIEPTVENVARTILAEIAAHYRDDRLTPRACHLVQSERDAATAYVSGGIERHVWTSFSAARRTASPHLNDAENAALFGVAARSSGHGHNYRLRITLAGRFEDGTGQIVDDASLSAAVAALRADLDHVNLSCDVPWLAGVPITTEVLASTIARRLARDLPVVRVRLYELPDFFAEAGISENGVALSVSRTFFAAHRLRSPHLSDEENRSVYGKCNNANGHGHGYTAEATVAATLDERTGTVCSLTGLVDGLEAALAPWAYRHLDAEVEAFRDRPSTGENIVSLLWPRLADTVPAPLVRLRLWETENNRFALRAPIASGVRGGRE